MRITRERIIPATAERTVKETVTVCDYCPETVGCDNDQCWACRCDLCSTCYGQVSTASGYTLGAVCPRCRELFGDRYRVRIDKLGTCAEEVSRENWRALWEEWKRECIIAREKAESLAAEPKPESGG